MSVLKANLEMQDHSVLGDPQASLEQLLSQTIAPAGSKKVATPLRADEAPRHTPAKRPKEACEAEDTPAKTEEAKTAEWSAPSGALLCKKLSDRATVPTKGSKLAAGFDLYAAVPAPADGSEATVTIPPHGKALIKTDIAVRFDHIDVGPGCGLYARVAPRSGLAWKQHVGIGAGVVDADYRGNVGVVMFNHSPSEPVVVRQGDRVAQLVLERYEHGVEQAVEVADLGGETERGAGGFGSTGK